MLAETSRMAFRSLNKLGDKQRQVYNAISELGSASNEQIAIHLDWPIQSVTGRVNELARFGMLRIEGLTIGMSGRKAKSWSVVDMNDRNLTKLSMDCA